MRNKRGNDICFRKDYCGNRKSMPQVSRYVYNKFERDTSIELDRSLTF